MMTTEAGSSYLFETIYHSFVNCLVISALNL